MTPVVHRTGLAIRPLVEIARDGELSLVCDQVHPGPCEWPGETVGGDRLMQLIVGAPGNPVKATIDERPVSDDEDEHRDDRDDSGAVDA